MSDLLKRLHESRMRAVNAAREIAERAASGEERAEDEAAYTAANADITKYGALIADETKRSADDREIAEQFAASSRAAGVDENGSAEKRELVKTWRDEARAAISEQRATIGGQYESLPNEARQAELRTMLVGTATAGGHTVPTTLVEKLFQKLFDDSAILSAGVTILRTGSGETLKFPRLTSLGALSQSNARRAEGATIQKSDPAFDQVQLDAYKYGQITQLSRELIEDSVFDVQSLAGTVLGRNMANYLGYDLTLGSGSSQPNGVVTLIPSGNKVTSATGQTVKPTNIDQILDVIAKLKPTYRRNAKFLMNDSTTFVLRKFKINTTTGDNAYAWQPGLVPGSADTFMGYPLLTDPNISATGLSALSIVFADFSQYYVRLVNDVRVEWSTEYAWDTDLVSVKAVLRADGEAIDDTAFAAFVGAAS